MAQHEPDQNSTEAAASGVYVLLDNSLADDGACTLFESPVEIVRCDKPDEVEGALERIAQAGSKGLPESLATIGRASLLDPWGSPYQYLNFELATGGAGDNKGKGKGKGFPTGARMDRFLVPINSTYDLYSMGKDGKTVVALTAKDSIDDIVRANDGGFIGLAAKY